MVDAVEWFAVLELFGMSRLRLDEGGSAALAPSNLCHTSSSTLPSAIPLPPTEKIRLDGCSEYTTLA